VTLTPVGWSMTMIRQKSNLRSCGETGAGRRNGRNRRSAMPTVFTLSGSKSQKGGILPIDRGHRGGPHPFW
jgi:hypothetical protein